MAKIIVVRHAETLANKRGIYQGQSFDLGLSTLGKKQALALAKEAIKLKVKKIYVSPLKRTIDTAKPAIHLTEAKVILCKEIMETNHGTWEGLDKTKIEKIYPDVCLKWKKYPAEVEFPGGERFIETINRVDRFLRLTNFRGVNMFVTHDNILRIMVCLANKIPMNNLWSIKADQASINIFNIKGINGKKKLEVEKLNIKNHLMEYRSNIAVQAL